MIFNWESISGKYDDGGFYGQCYLSKDVSVQNRIEHTYDPNFESNQTTESLADQIAKYKAAFAAEDDILSELHSKRTFSETLLTLTKLVELVEEKTLVILDEPEEHLHPPLVSAFIRALSKLVSF